METEEDSRYNYISFSGCSPERLNKIKTMVLMAEVVREDVAFAGLHIGQLQRLQLLVGNSRWSELSLSHLQDCRAFTWYTKVLNGCLTILLMAKDQRL